MEVHELKKVLGEVPPITSSWGRVDSKKVHLNEARRIAGNAKRKAKKRCGAFAVRRSAAAPTSRFLLACGRRAGACYVFFIFTVSHQELNGISKGH